MDLKTHPWLGKRSDDDECIETCYPDVISFTRYNICQNHMKTFRHRDNYMQLSSILNVDGFV